MEWEALPPVEVPARLQAEVRRTALALKEYRQAAGGRSLSVLTDDAGVDQAATG